MHIENIREAYEILGLDPGASLDDAKSARRSLVKKWHPDLHRLSKKSQDKATERTKIINDAHDRVAQFISSGASYAAPHASSDSSESYQYGEEESYKQEYYYQEDNYRHKEWEQENDHEVDSASLYELLSASLDWFSNNKKILASILSVILIFTSGSKILSDRKRVMGNLEECGVYDSESSRFGSNDDTASFDLNDDGDSEVFHSLKGECGMGGCSLVIAHANSQDTPLADIFAGFSPVYVSQTSTLGWRDVMIYYGRISAGQTWKRFVFNGDCYKYDGDIPESQVDIDVVLFGERD